MWRLLIIGGIVAGAGAYLFRLKRTSKHLESSIRARIHKISFTEIIIRLDVRLKNPTSGTLSLKYPFVKLSYKDQVIGTSQATNKDVTIPPHGETTIPGITIRLPLLKLTGLAKSLVNIIKGSSEGMSVEATTITTIDVGLGRGIPYEKTDPIVLKKTVPGS